LKPPRTLVISAFEPEIAPLRPLVRGAGRVVLAAAGIGAVDAAVGAARAIAATHPTRVIFVGTAGVYGRAVRPGLEIGSAAVVGEIACVSTAELRGEGYLPAPTALRAETGRRLRKGLSSTAGTAGTLRSVACPLAITRASALARRISAATSADLENLEAFAIARAAAAAGVEFAAVLGVANRVGPRGHDEWRRHHRTASQAACVLVARFLGLAPSA
jgi:nucleoside phosphorylase